MIVTVRHQRPRTFVVLALLFFLLYLVYERLERGLNRLDQVLCPPWTGAVNNNDRASGNSPCPGLGSTSAGMAAVSASTDSPALSVVQHIKGGVPPSEAMLDFWEDLLAAMVDARPDTDATVVINDPVNDYDMNANPFIDQTRGLIDKAHVSDELRDALTTAHARFRRSADRLSRRLPYAGKTKKHDVPPGDGGRDAASAMPLVEEEGAETASPTAPATATIPTEPAAPAPTRGIVMTAGGNYIGVAVTSLLMLRRNGSKLPVQLFLDDVSGYAETLCEGVLSSLGVACHSMKRFWETTPDMPGLTKFQFKVCAILFSTYREVLFLDADIWPIRSPDYLFDAEPFRSRGLVTWPDFWLPTAAPVVYDILGIPTPEVKERRSSEAGILLYDKARHSLSLVLAAYYNFYGPDYYYRLLSQGAHGEGDKETFLHGALVAGSPFYAVHTRTGMVGRWLNGEFRSVAMKQADPVEDFQLFEEMEARKSAGEDLQGGLPSTTRLAFDEEEAVAVVEEKAKSNDDDDDDSHDYSQEEVDENGDDNDNNDDDLDRYVPLSPEEAARQRDEAETIHARTLFVHHNLYKLDVRQLAGSMGNVYATNEQGQMTRLWGDEGALDASAGYDVERAMWEEVGRAVCGHGPVVATKECDDFGRYYEEVFGESIAAAYRRTEGRDEPGCETGVNV